MKEWIQLPTRHEEGYNVYEVKCPDCGQKVTFTQQPPLNCYVCCSTLYMPEGWSEYGRS